MKKTAIFYGSSSGVTADVAKKLAEIMKVDDVYDVAETSPFKMAEYDRLILGSSTHGNGELQDDWYDFLGGAEAMDLAGKEVAIFGTGDVGMADTFCDAIAKIRHGLEHTGATFTGEFNADGYDFEHSEARLPDGNMMGLVLDENNHPQWTDGRLREWARALK